MSDNMEVRRRPPRRFQAPIKYEVGKDITEQEYSNIIIALTNWIREFRPAEKEPGTIAKLRLDECLQGIKKDGTPWYDMDTASLAKRVRSKLRFDIETMKPLRTAGEKQRAKKTRERTRKVKSSDDKLLPDAMREKLRKEWAYGDDPNMFMTSAEQREWQRLKDAYIEQFPQLGTINAEAELNSLCDVHIEMTRFRARRAAGEKFDPEQEQGCIKRFVEMKKALGIHPDQLAKLTKTKGEYSVGEAVRRLESMGDDWKSVRDRMALEEFLVLFKMYHTPNADGSGFQLDEVGLFALTRCRPIPCPNCNTVHVFGLPMDMIQEWLQTRGVLEEVDEDTNQTDGDIQEPSEAVEMDGGTED